MSASTLTTFSAFLKKMYSKDKVEAIGLTSARPFLTKLKKNKDFGGESLVVPVIHAGPQGISGNFASAQSNASNLKGKAFTVTCGALYGVVEVGDQVLKASRNNAGAFLNNKTAEIEYTMEGLYNELSAQVWRGNGGLAIGQRGSISGNIVTLSDPDDVQNFEEGMTVVASDATGRGSSDALRTGSTTVASVDREAGTVTLTDQSAITNFANSDYLFRQGCFAGNTTVQMLYGVNDYIYSSSSSVPNLYGMVRTSDPSRLAGIRVATSQLSGLGASERIMELLTQMSGRHKVSGMDECWVSPSVWNQIAIEQMSKGIKPHDDTTGIVGLKAIDILAGGSVVRCYADPHVPSSTAFVINSKVWELSSMGELITFDGEDGLQLLRKASSTDYEIRFMSYSALICRAPGFNGRVSIA